MRVFNERVLPGDYPFVLVDALFIKSRENERVVRRAALILSGVRSDGYRELLGVQIGDSESFVTRDKTFRWLKAYGLKGVLFVVSDEHSGLTQAIAKQFQGATRQRCQVHLMRKLLSRSPVKVGAEVAGSARRVLQASDSGETHSGRFSGRTPNAHPSRYRRDERRAGRP